MNCLCLRDFGSPDVPSGGLFHEIFPNRMDHQYHGLPHSIAAEVFSKAIDFISIVVLHQSCSTRIVCYWVLNCFVIIRLLRRPCSAALLVRVLFGRGTFLYPRRSDRKYGFFSSSSFIDQSISLSLVAKVSISSIDQSIIRPINDDDACERHCRRIRRSML